MNNCILNNMNKVPTVSSLQKEGIDYINVSKHSETELGKKLAYGHPIKTNTVFGKIGTIRSLMEFISTPNYPTELLSKQKLEPREIKRIPSKRISVPNYWAIVAYVICERIDQDDEVKELIKNNKLTYTSFNKKRNDTLFDKEVVIGMPNHKMGRYLSIIRHIDTMLKEDKFTKENIKEFITACKDKPEQDIFEGTAVSITINDKIKPVKEE